MSPKCGWSGSVSVLKSGYSPPGGLHRASQSASLVPSHVASGDPVLLLNHVGQNLPTSFSRYFTSTCVASPATYSPVPPPPAMGTKGQGSGLTTRRRLRARKESASTSA